MDKNDKDNLISPAEGLSENDTDCSEAFVATENITANTQDNNPALSATEVLPPVAFSDSADGEPNNNREPKDNGVSETNGKDGEKILFDGDNCVTKSEFIAKNLVARAKEFGIVDNLIEHAEEFGIKDTLIARAEEYGIKEQIIAHSKEYKIVETVKAKTKEYNLKGVVKARAKEVNLTELIMARAREYGIPEDVIARTLEYKIPSEIIARAKEFDLPDELVARIAEIVLPDKEESLPLSSSVDEEISEEVPEEVNEEIQEENDDDFDEDVDEPEEEEKNPFGENLEADFPKTPVDQRLLDAYTDTCRTADELLSRHDIYTEYMTVLAEGLGKIHLSERLMLRSVDEIWVKAIEECINSLDELIRNPNHFIAESEEVLPIEKTKRISGRSIAHLCRHTDYITVNEDDEISPLKMLNVFREDSLLTYENKFLNTLINRLYLFVNKRYKVAKDYGVDEKTECFEYENSFNHGEGKGKIKISVEYSERNISGGVKNKLLGTGLWARVERLNSIVTGYINSPFVAAMEKNYVHPPILRTNAILKNKYFRECLALWEFIESYDDAGYGITVEESEHEMSDEYVRQIYAGAAMQYLLFRHNMELGAVEDAQTSKVIPSYNLEKVKMSDYTEEFSDEIAEPVSSDSVVADALKVALIADEIISANEKKEDVSDGLVKSFNANIRLAPEDVKRYFVEIYNSLIVYNGVETRFTKRFATFYANGKPVVRASVGEKSIKLYLALDPAAVDESLGVINVSERKGFATTPSAFVVHGDRSLSVAKELINSLIKELKLTFGEGKAELASVSDFETETIELMREKGWIYSADGVKGGEISFGPEKNGISEKKAKILADVNVRENIGADKLASMEAETKRPVSVPNRKRTAADDLAQIVRPESNYAKPTEFGIDDSSGFLKDAASDKERQ